ncbi:MAG: GIY-YIG nuclease family protein [Candidatus Acidiferrales bacterium]
MAKKHPVVVKAAAQMWPRWVLDFEGWPEVRDRLREQGVYVLYRDDTPYYVGQTKIKKLFRRIRAHAVNPRDRYFQFWNYFSAFVVPNARHRDEVEGVLIAAMPTANSAAPRIHRITLPKEVTTRIKQLRKKAIEVDE